MRRLLFLYVAHQGDPVTIPNPVVDIEYKLLIIFNFIDSAKAAKSTLREKAATPANESTARRRSEYRQAISTHGLLAKIGRLLTSRSGGCCAATSEVFPAVRIA